MKFNKKILNSSLVLVIALGLGGCAINSATTTHKSNNEAVSSSQVVKHSQKKATKNGKTAVKTAAASKSSESKTSTPVSAASTTVSNSQSATTVNTSSASQATTTNKQTSNKNVTANASSTAATKTNVTTNDNAKSTATKEQEHQEIQLGLGDVASWTDDHGITHHVDSDGMDRQTIAGSEEVHYQDWSGSLPSNAVVTHADAD